MSRKELENTNEMFIIIIIVIIIIDIIIIIIIFNWINALDWINAF